MAALKRLMSIRMTLRHVLYISYLLPASRIRPMVPDALTLATLGSDRVFISIVSLKCENVRLANLPWPRFTYNQLNLRTYVRDPITGNSAVYFFRSGVTSTATSLLTSSIGLPWRHINLELQISRDSQTRYSRYLASGRWDGETVIEAEESQSPLTEIEPFDNLESAVEYLTGPRIGFIGPEGRARRFEIRHRQLEVRLGKLHEIRIPVANATGLLEEGEVEEPHNVLLVPEAEFTVYLPPRRI